MNHLSHHQLTDWLDGGRSGEYLSHPFSLFVRGEVLLVSQKAKPGKGNIVMNQCYDS